MEICCSNLNNIYELVGIPNVFTKITETDSVTDKEIEDIRAFQFRWKALKFEIFNNIKIYTENEMNPYYQDC